MLSPGQEFIEFAIRHNILRFGEFKTKAGRLSPYFFNAGLFCEGAKLRELAQFYAKALAAAEFSFDMLFGPAYKGIPLATALACTLAEKGHNVPFSFNRKEQKQHGEGGSTIGAPIQGRVLIVDDVISAGTSLRESIGLIQAQGGKAAGLVVALDRMEKGLGELSAAQEVNQSYGLPVLAIATLEDLMAYLSTDSAMAYNLHKITQYKEQYGAKA